MAEVLLKCGARALVDDADLPLVAGRVWRIQWRYEAGRKISPAAVVSGGNGRPVLMHRLLLGATGGQIDHANCNPLDNRRANLRECSAAENTRNRPLQANNRARAKGVYRTGSGRWRATIRAAGMKIALGTFSTKSEAAAAYAGAAPRYHGEFARTA